MSSKPTTITAEAEGQRVTATATEGHGIILNASRCGSTEVHMDVHIDGAELRELLERLLLVPETSKPEG